MIYTYLKEYGDNQLDIEFQTTSKKALKEYLKANEDELYGYLQGYCTKKNKIYFSRFLG